MRRWVVNEIRYKAVAGWGGFELFPYFRSDGLAAGTRSVLDVMLIPWIIWQCFAKKLGVSAPRSLRFKS